MIEMNAVFLRVDRHFRDSRVTEHLLSLGAESRAFLGDVEKMKALSEKIESFGYSAETSTDEEHSVQRLLYRQGSQSPRLIGYQQLSSPEYHRLQVLHKSIRELDQAPFIAKTESGTATL